mmetsp:Transcript_23604/g.34797  ORF Transcript_23604/g.34797 Transcript_23604/m.34797 type:complete len:106 (+) Transcript_23604:297-614(+)
MAQEAARKNICILRKYKNDLGEALQAHRDTPLEYRSEFRSQESLAKIFRLHPNWIRMKTMLEKGSNWPLEELDFETRRKDLDKALEFGNHKGATKISAPPKKLVE